MTAGRALPQAREGPPPAPSGVASEPPLPSSTGEAGSGGDAADRWWVYLLECDGGRLYTGIARDPERRFRQHASGKGARFTRSFRPIRILAVLPAEGRSGASRLEREAKSLKPDRKRAFFRCGEATEGG